MNALSEQNSFVCSGLTVYCVHVIQTLSYLDTLAVPKCQRLALSPGTHTICISGKLSMKQVLDSLCRSREGQRENIYRFSPFHQLPDVPPEPKVAETPS